MADSTNPTPRSSRAATRFWRCTAPGVNATFATRFGVIMFLLMNGGKGVRIFNTSNVGGRNKKSEATLSYEPVDPTGAYGSFAPDEPVGSNSVGT